ncbi:hypothetical protein XO47_15205 [Listeria monocytogenes]|nr:hypothetical protein [Listeria monocytogenes]
METKLKISGTQTAEYLKAHMEQIGGVTGLEVVQCKFNYDEAQREQIEALVAKYDVNVSLEG